MDNSQWKKTGEKRQRITSILGALESTG